MLIWQFLLNLVTSNLRPILLSVAALLSVSSLYYGIGSYFERRAALLVIKHQADELKAQQNHCNRLTTNYLNKAKQLNQELRDEKYSIDSNPKVTSWSHQRLPTDIKRLLSK